MQQGSSETPEGQSKPIGDIDAMWLAWEDGELDDTLRDRLRQRLVNDPEARRQFVEAQMLSVGLRNELELRALGDIASDPLPAVVVPARDLVDPHDAIYQVRRLPRWMLALVAGVLLAIFGRWVHLEWRTTHAVAAKRSVQSREVGELRSQGIAVMAQVVDGRLTNLGRDRQVGSALMPGPLRLNNGLARVEFFCGATVTLEGPAKLDLISATEARLIEGSIRAVVPPAARGFVIHAPEVKLVDLGTEFGVEIRGGRPSVHVFDGEVEVHPDGAPRRMLVGGQSSSADTDWNAVGSMEETAYPQPQSLIDRLAERTKRRQQQWSSFSDQLRQDPRLLVYYPFDQRPDWQRKLINASRAGHDVATTEFDGAIVGATTVQGRWPGRAALNFKQPGDRVRLRIPGEFGSLTMAAWVRIDSLDREYNSLFLTDNYQAGEPHWQILQNGRLHFSVRPPHDRRGRPEHFVSLSPSFWDWSLSGSWVHLAVVYNVNQHTTTHYVDGKPIHEDEIPPRQRVETTRLGMASLGNWSVPTRPDEDFAVRNLNGSIDEFAIFTEALPHEEIEMMYERGRP